MFPYEPNCYSPFDHNKNPPDQNPPPLFTIQDPSIFVQHESSLPSIDYPTLPENQISTMYPQESNIPIPSHEEKQVNIKPEPLIRRMRNTGAIPRRRAGKKDRHSKICTAQGIRDRRMRLSLQIARKFFDLQDMLGYDKASKTIEWLFAKSNNAIEELFKGHPQYYEDKKSEGFVSECEVVSGKPMMIEEDIGNPCQRENQRVSSKPSDLRLASREKARDRARRRTREKMMSRILEGSGGYGSDQNLGFSFGPILKGSIDQGWSLSDQERVSLCGNVYGDVGTIEKFLGTSSRSCLNSDYQNRAALDYNMDPNGSFMRFFGSWDLLSNERTISIPCASGNDQALLRENPSSVYSATP